MHACECFGRCVVQTLKDKPANDTLLKIYGLYKQATVGDNNASQVSNVASLMQSAGQYLREIVCSHHANLLSLSCFLLYSLGPCRLRHARSTMRGRRTRASRRTPPRPSTSLWSRRSPTRRSKHWLFANAARMGQAVFDRTAR
jgi:hypothetical protein